MLFSIVVPVYGVEKYIHECVDSILNQTYKDFELILVDDGSTKDDTASICDEFCKLYPNIIKAINRENGGHGQAVNTGLANATGKYFKVVDSDDWVDPSAMEKFMQTLENLSEDVDAFFMNYVYEYTVNGTQRVISYKGKMPQEQVFTFCQNYGILLSITTKTRRMVWNRQ